MDLLQSAALAGGMAWASGLRLYAVLLAAGLLSRYGYVELPAALQVLENPWIIGIAGLLFVVEFLADKIPAVDSIWDGIQTFIRIPAGAVLSALAMGDHDPALMVAAGLLGGTITAGTHIAKAGSRALINASPEPVTNVATSFGEDALVTTGLLAAFYHPAVFLVALVLFVVLLIWLIPKVLRGMRSLFGGLFGKARAP